MFTRLQAPPRRKRAPALSRRSFLAGAGALLAFSGLSCSEPTDPKPAGVRVVLISLDGLRPDAVTATNMPTLVRLAMEGAATLAAETVQPSLTLPAHTSMVTGLTPARHGVTWNDDATTDTGYLAAQTIFDVAAVAGYTSAMFVGKSKLRPIVHDAAPTRVNMPPVGKVWKSDTVAAHVRTYLTGGEPKPRMMFIHLPDIDVVGHAFGWMSPEYLTAARHVDSTVAGIWAGLKQAFGTEFVLIVTADHGGFGRDHYDGSQPVRTIPWIAWGKDVEPQTLTAKVRAVDVAPTMLWVLGLTPPADWDGVAVTSAFRR
jgi:predicted AlkP superfamily pyrophosphatase or phosphodiesterase